MDTDVVFNPTGLFATDARADRAEIQGLLTHELGHALGLDHTPLIAASMSPFIQPGETAMRTPCPDDLAGVREIYDRSADAATGVIAGTVVIETGAPVFGAHVVAVDADGIAQISTLSEQDGGFEIRQLPAGSYTVYAEPVNGLVQCNNLPQRFQNRQTPALNVFLLTFAGGNRSPLSVTVAARETASLAPIVVEARAPALKVESWLWSWNGSSPWHTWRGIEMGPGRLGYLALRGPGVALIENRNFAFSGRDVAIDYSRMWRGSGDTPWVTLPVTTSYTARPGPRSLFLIGNSEPAVLSGIVDVAPR